MVTDYQVELDEGSPTIESKSLEDVSLARRWTNGFHCLALTATMRSGLLCKLSVHRAPQLAFYPRTIPIHHWVDLSRSARVLRRYLRAEHSIEWVQCAQPGK